MAFGPPTHSPAHGLYLTLSLEIGIQEHEIVSLVADVFSLTILTHVKWKSDQIPSFDAIIPTTYWESRLRGRFDQELLPSFAENHKDKRKFYNLARIKTFPSRKLVAPTHPSLRLGFGSFLWGVFLFLPRPNPFREPGWTLRIHAVWNLKSQDFIASRSRFNRFSTIS